MNDAQWFFVGWIGGGTATFIFTLACPRVAGWIERRWGTEEDK